MGIQIINGGFLTTIQDMGRYGYQETGMSVSGVMDTRACLLYTSDCDASRLK